MYAIVQYGRRLIDGPNRIATTTVVEFNSALFRWLGKFRGRPWLTQIVDVARVQTLDVMPHRHAESTCARFDQGPAERHEAIQWEWLNLSGPYRAVFETMIPTPPRWPISSTT